MALDAKQRAFIVEYARSGSIADAIAAQNDSAKVESQEIENLTELDEKLDGEENSPISNAVVNIAMNAQEQAKKLGLTPKQSRFISEYVICNDSKIAAVRAGYLPDRADRAGYALKEHKLIKRLINETQREILAQNHMSADGVLRALSYLSDSDSRSLYHPDGKPKQIHELDTATARAIKSIKTVRRKSGELDENGDPVYENHHEFTFWDKPVALDKLAKYHGILADRPEIDPLAAEDQEIRRALRRKLLMELGNAAKPAVSETIPPTLNQDGSEV